MLKYKLGDGYISGSTDSLIGIGVTYGRRHDDRGGSSENSFSG